MISALLKYEIGLLKMSKPNLSAFRMHFQQALIPKRGYRHWINVVFGDPGPSLTAQNRKTWHCFIAMKFPEFKRRVALNLFGV